MISLNHVPAIVRQIARVGLLAAAALCAFSLGSCSLETPAVSPSATLAAATQTASATPSPSWTAEAGGPTLTPIAPETWTSVATATRPLRSPVPPSPTGTATASPTPITPYPPPVTPSPVSVTPGTPYPPPSASPALSSPTSPPTAAPSPTASASFTATPPPSATWTAPAAAAVERATYPTVVPILYEMHDYANIDYRIQYPQWGPLGSWMWWTWAQLQPEPNRYNWALVDNYLAEAAKQQVVLRSGEVIPKPVALTVQVYPDLDADATPPWVYQRFIPGASRLGDRYVGWVVDPDGPEGRCAPVGVPMWGDPTWERLFDEFVMAFGQRYERDPRVNSVWIATSLYGETIEEKTYGGCRYVFSHGAHLARWVLHVMDTYRKAFPTKPLFIINSGGWGIRKDTAAKAATYDPPIGIKLNVLAPDLGDSYGYKSLAGGGKFEIVNRYSDTLPIAFEHAFAARPADAYWSIMNGLAHRAVLMDFDHPEMFNVIRSLDPIFPLWDFIDAHLGRDAKTTPDVWILLRETYFPASKFQGWSSGEYGDWHFFLTRPEGIPGNRTVAITETISAELPAPARQHIYGFHSTRRTDQASGNRYMSFAIDHRYPYWGELPIASGGSVGYRVEVVFLNRGQDEIGLEYLNGKGELITRTVRKGPELGPVDDWVTVTWELTDAYFAGGLPGGTDFRLDCRGDGDEYVHRIIVTGFRK